MISLFTCIRDQLNVQLAAQLFASLACFVGCVIGSAPLLALLFASRAQLAAKIISMANSGPDTNGPRSLASPAASKQPAEQCAALFAARRRPTNVSI